jgi:hypothetical protein
LQSHLLFNSHIGQVKRAETIEDNPGCPFCARHLLAEILDEDGSILLVKNKYPVLENTFQTVLIETDDCLSELSLYPREHLHRVLNFGIRNWFELIHSKNMLQCFFSKITDLILAEPYATPTCRSLGWSTMITTKTLSRHSLQA